MRSGFFLIYIPKELQKSDFLAIINFSILP